MPAIKTAAGLVSDAFAETPYMCRATARPKPHRAIHWTGCAADKPWPHLASEPSCTACKPRPHLAFLCSTGKPWPHLAVHWPFPDRVDSQGLQIVSWLPSALEDRAKAMGGPCEVRSLAVRCGLVLSFIRHPRQVTETDAVFLFTHDVDAKKRI